MKYIRYRLNFNYNNYNKTNFKLNRKAFVCMKKMECTFSTGNTNP